MLLTLYATVAERYASEDADDEGDSDTAAAGAPDAAALEAAAAFSASLAALQEQQGLEGEEGALGQLAALAAQHAATLQAVRETAELAASVRLAAALQQRLADFDAAAAAGAYSEAAWIGVELQKGVQAVPGSEDTAAAVAARVEPLGQHLLEVASASWGVDPASRMPVLAPAPGADPQQQQGGTDATAAHLAEAWRALQVLGLLPQALQAAAARFLEQSVAPILASGAKLGGCWALLLALPCACWAAPPRVAGCGWVSTQESGGLLTRCRPPACRRLPRLPAPSRARPWTDQRQPRGQRGEQQPEPRHRRGRRPRRQLPGAAALQGAAGAGGAGGRLRAVPVCRCLFTSGHHSCSKLTCCRRCLPAHASRPCTQVLCGQEELAEELGALLWPGLAGAYIQAKLRPITPQSDAEVRLRRRQRCRRHWMLANPGLAWLPSSPSHLAPAAGIPEWVYEHYVLLTLGRRWSCTAASRGWEPSWSRRRSSCACCRVSALECTARLLLLLRWLHAPPPAGGP